MNYLERTWPLWAYVLLLGLLLLSQFAHAQPSWQYNSVPYCPIPGAVDAQGNPIVVPCGYVYGPIFTQEVRHGDQPYNTTQCPANPISKKIPPLC